MHEKIERRKDEFDMTLSEEIVRRMIKNGETKELGDLGFILTVIRDNCLCDSTFELLDILVRKMHEQLLEENAPEA